MKKAVHCAFVTATRLATEGGARGNVLVMTLAREALVGAGIM